LQQIIQSFALVRSLILQAHLTAEAHMYLSAI
jgi:hypothetical protein